LFADHQADGSVVRGLQFQNYRISVHTHNVCVWLLYIAC